MTEFEGINLRDTSLAILQYISGKPPLKAAEIAEALNLKPRQVDAAVTKSLVRFGFALRQIKFTKLMKKEYKEITITPRGERYLSQLRG